MILFVGTTLSVLMGWVYYTDRYVPVKTKVKYWYTKWCDLIKLVSSKHDDALTIRWISMKMIIQACYMNFLQYMNSTIVKIGPNTYEIVYIINGNMYKMVVKPQRGPPPILQISNDKQEDVTDLVLPYMGPKYDWHGNKFTPKFFDCDTLTFELSNGTECTFDKDAKMTVE